MATSKQDIQRWFERGVADKATHMIVVVDTFDYDDYPVYVGAWESAAGKVAEYNGKSMQRVIEVYDLRKAMQPQLDEHRSFNL